MSLNTAHANGGVLIFNGEVILLYCDDVELKFEGDDAKIFSGAKKGRIYLTTHRMIFVNKSEKDPLQSFSFPFFSMKKIDLEQPIFGANFIKGLVIAQTGGNWTGEAQFKLKFFAGGAIEFGQAMLRAAKMANQYMPPQPPAYTAYQGPYFPAPPPAYAPPAGGMCGFVPPVQAFPQHPPENSVYMTEMPPPYPGIYPPGYSNVPYVVQPQANGPSYGYGYPVNQAPPPSYGYSAGAAPPQNYGYPASSAAPVPGFNVNDMPNAAANAPMQSAHNPAYNPQANVYQGYRNPVSNNVYMPAQAQNGYQNFQEPPPPYSEYSKKEQ